MKNINSEVAQSLAVQRLCGFSTVPKLRTAEFEMHKLCATLLYAVGSSVFAPSITHGTKPVQWLQAARKGNDMPTRRDEPRIEIVEIEKIKFEDGVKELLQSPAMAPYLRYQEALVKGEPVATARAEIAALPLEKRYVWRVASALKWAFADSDDESVKADWATLSKDERQRLVDSLKFRPLQFCLFLQGLWGTAQMQKVMNWAVEETVRLAKLEPQAR